MNVEVILDNNIAALLKDEKKLFTYVEIKFFSIWFDKQTSDLQA